MIILQYLVNLNITWYFRNRYGRRKDALLRSDQPEKHEDGRQINKDNEKDVNSTKCELFCIINIAMYQRFDILE